MNAFYLIIIPAVCTAFYSCNTGIPDYPIDPVPFSSVKVNDDFWNTRLETNRKITIPYGFEMCEKTGRIDNFLIAGGLKAGRFCSTYPFDDSDVYKIIEGASYSLATDDDPALDRYLDSLIEFIAAAQEDDGYLETWRTIDPDKPLAEWWGTAERWSNLPYGHELYNAGHLYEAAVAHYQATGKNSLLNIALKNAGLVCDVFGPGKKSGVPGHEEIEIGLMKLFRTTNDKKYLDMAGYFIEQRGKTVNRESGGEYNQDHLPVREQREAVGHAVRAGYLYSSIADFSSITGDTTFYAGLKATWNDIVNHKLYITGGVGARGEGESFGKPYDLPNATAYAETCAAISMVLWNDRMFRLTGESKYIDFLERTLYNGFLSGVGLDGRSFFYTNPLESDGTASANYDTPVRQPWFTCACCPSNIARFIPQIPGFIYAIKYNLIYVNLYISNKAVIEAAGTRVYLNMDSGYPWDGKTVIHVDPDEPEDFGIAFRVPGTVTGKLTGDSLYRILDPEKAQVSLSVNGRPVKWA
ncbi:MAG TPA: beta-L-arabinofuranosidase domain-containing protein, partial [Cyclobacteriaceae bacterium]|nr:beta-L-arabinofuranosidase domain-containing protein [Cyclobacteriaceae bacterium]